MPRGIPNSEHSATDRAPAPIPTRSETLARIVLALSKLPTDADRLAVLTSLANLYESVVTVPLDAEDLARIVAAVAQCEQMVASMSAAKAGTTLAPAGIKLPPALRGGR